MFTGIVEDLGEVETLEHLGDFARIYVRSDVVTQDARTGDSICVNGVCLTVTGFLPPGGTTPRTGFTADVMGETLRHSSLKSLAQGTKVNLERSVRLADRLGGHLVQGHTDGTGTVISRDPQENWEVVRIGLPAGLARYVVHKGSIAVDGVSLTVSALSPGGKDDWFEVSLIPETLKRTTLGIKQPGAEVNLEVDVIAKYVEKLTGGDPVTALPDTHATALPQPTHDGLNMENLAEELSVAIPLDEVARAIKDIADGRPVVVVDDADRENEGDIILAASKATPELIAFMVRYTSGVICAPMRGADLDRLHLPLMTTQNTERMRTAFTVTIDAAEGVTTGISAADRTTTLRKLTDPDAAAGDFVRPGHIFPLRARDEGVLVRPGHTEAAVDLATLAGLPPVGVLAEIVHDDGTMMRLPALREFADEHGLALISIEQLIEHRRHTERLVARVAETVIPNAYGAWRVYGYRSEVDGGEHLALVLGDLEANDGEDVLTRVHSECLTGDVFGSQRCDCGAQLDAAMAKIAERGRGVVLYLRGHEGRGIGLLSKLQAYRLQDAGEDTVDANLKLGLPVDAREYSVATQLLDDLGVRSVRLLTNNPAKVEALAAHGFGVTRIPLPPLATPHNLRYLTAKRDRLGHQLETLDADERAAAEVS